MSSPYKQTIAGKFLISLLLSIVIGATLAFLPGHSSTRRIEPAASIPPVLVEQPESLEAYSSLVSASPAVREPDQRTQVRAKEAYGNLPLSFEINQGQTDSQAKFMSRGAGYNLFLTANESVMVLSKPAARKASRGPNTAPEKEQTTRTAVVRMKLVDANQQARILGLEELPGKSNYFNGNDPKKWRSNVSNYAKVKYESVYPGVDMVYHGNQGELEYDFVISPGADTRVIRLGFEGARHLRIARNGDVVLTMREGKLRQQRPIAYQLFDGRRREVFSHYVMAGKDQIAIEVGAYDRSRELVIDPILAYSTFLGGSDAEFAKDLAVDAAGNAYVTGFTSSTNFPTRNPIQSSGGGFDAFVTKINPAGSATVYSTYVGGNDSDNGEAIKIDAFGSAYVTGITSSTNFPTFNAFQSTAGGSQDAFVLKLSATGDALVYATYLGGNFDDLGYDIAVDGAGSAYVTGSTESTNFPTLNPYDGSYNSPELEDAFITKLSPAGNALVYSTYLGGSLYDDGYGIAVDSLGNAYVTGYTQSANFPTAAALYPNQSFNSADAFVTKLNPTGAALVFSTFLGGPSPDYAKDIALDPSGNIYVTGQAGDGFPIVNAYQPMNGGDYDAFVTKMDPTATSIIYSTYLGGSVEDEGKSIAVDSSENVFITGFTLSTDFPKVRGLQGSYGGGPADMLIAKFNAAGTLSFSTYLGTVTEEVGHGIAVDSSSNAYVAGFARSSSFPTVGSLQPYGGGTCDAVILKLTGLLSYNISGRVTDALNSSLSAVTVTLSGSQSGTTQTDANGNYTFADVSAGGNYTVTPSKSPYTFVPTNQTINGLSANQTLDFTVATYSINGSVTGFANAPTSGVTVVLSGTQANTTQTDANGNYSFPAVAKGGNYTVTPSKVDPILTYAFSPVSQAINGLSANQTINFSSLPSIISSLNSTADAYVQDGTGTNTNFGAVSPLKVETDSKTNNSKNFDAYFKFDASGVAGNISSVKLRIFASSSTAAGATTSVYSVSNTSWVESGAGSITWNNKPARSATALAGATATVNSTTFTSYDLDVTAYVKSEKSAGRDVISLALHNPSSSTIFINLNSREASANKPQLIATVGTNPNAAPSVNLTSPAVGAPFTSPATITVSANATDSDGSISKVEFYAGTISIGTATSPPYQVTWPAVAAGTYSLTAVATDNSSASTVSPAVTVVVNQPNSLPSVYLNSPLEGTTFSAGTNVTLEATASDSDGTISKVDFFAGATLVGTDTTPTSGNLYSVSWNNINSGVYALTAKATDNATGLTPSAAVNINVVAPLGLSPTADAYVRDGSSATTNFGTAATLQTQSFATAGDNRESYLKFDLTTVTGIKRATVRLYGNLSDVFIDNVTAGIYSVATTTWVESGSGSITWNNKPAAGPTPLATTVITNWIPRWYEFDVTDYLQAEKVAGRNVVSLVVKNTVPSGLFGTFNSKEAAAKQPQLILWSTQPRNALLVVGSATLNNGDAAAQTRLQNLGYTVTVKVAGSNQNSSVKATDADGKALVIISSTVVAANVVNKLRNIPVPVINWEFDILDDMGMTGLVSGTDFGTSATTQQLNISDPTHPLAAGLTGSQTVVTTATAFTWGKPDMNVVRVAALTSDATRYVIFGYDSGATMAGLEAPAPAPPRRLEAPARRVALFLTDATAFSLNASGGALFDAAIRWSTNIATAPTISLLSSWSGLTPPSGPIGSLVSISGFNFGATQGPSTVTFNSVAAAPSYWSDKYIAVAVPAFASTGPVIVTVNGVSSNAVIFIVGDVDSDGDGLPDWWELEYFGDLSQGANSDADGDGLTNSQEYQQGRNPTKSALADNGDFVNLKLYTPLTAPSP